MSRKISDVKPKCDGKVIKKFNIQEEKSNLDKNQREIRECQVIIKDIKGQFRRKLQLFEEISLNNSEFKENRNCCKFCEKKFSFPTSLTKHIKHAHSSKVKVVSCELCDLKFYKKSFLDLHFKAKHPDGQAEQFECDFDGKIFKNKRILLSHITIHLSLVECQFCNKMLKFNYIKSHLKIFHATGQKFQCKICSKSFKSALYLNNHEKTHNKSHKCEICNKMYPSLGRLNHHKKEIHENLRIFECEICSKKFNQKYHMQNHQKIHDKNRLKSFKCHRCDYETDAKQSMKFHQAFHERQDKKVAAMRNPLKCNECATFHRNKKFLKHHMKVVHPKVLFQCDLCAIFIKTKSNLVKHINIHFKKLQKI